MGAIVISFVEVLHLLSTGLARHRVVEHEARVREEGGDHQGQRGKAGRGEDQHPAADGLGRNRARRSWQGIRKNA